MLDPFLGSGQTALVALQNQRRCIGCDVERSYLELTEQRLGATMTPREYQLIPIMRKTRSNGKTMQNHNSEAESPNFKAERQAFD